MQICWTPSWFKTAKEKRKKKKAEIVSENGNSLKEWEVVDDWQLPEAQGEKPLSVCIISSSILWLYICVYTSLQPDSLSSLYVFFHSSSPVYDRHRPFWLTTTAATHSESFQMRLQRDRWAARFHFNRHIRLNDSACKLLNTLAIL